MWNSLKEINVVCTCQNSLFLFFSSDATTKIKSYEQHSAEFIYNLNLSCTERASTESWVCQACPQILSQTQWKVGLESRSDYCSCSAVLRMATRLLQTEIMCMLRLLSAVHSNALFPLQQSIVPAHPMAPPSPSTTSSNNNSSSSSNSGWDQLSKTNLYIRALPPNTTDQDLVKLCQP